MPIVDYVSSGLRNFYAVLLKFSQNLFIGLNRISSNDNTRCCIARCDLAVPFSLSNLADFESVFWICVENSFEYFLRISWKYFGSLVLSCHDFFVKLACVLVFKRQVSAQHCIEDDPTGPDISTHALVALACDHLRGSIAWRSASSFKLLPWFILIREPKINYLNVLIMIQQ